MNNNRIAFKNLMVLTSIFIFLVLTASAQSDKAYRIQDDVYARSIQTVRLQRLGYEMSFPVINFNSDEQLKLTFDDLDRDIKYFRYTFVHCDALWNLSDLWQSDYISGFPDDMINNYQSSFNTIQPYTHYELIFPNDNFNFILPGNYLLIVFNDNNPDDVVLTRRFSVVDMKVSIDGFIRTPKTISERNQKQEIGFTVNANKYPLSDISRNLKVIIKQNCRWDNELYLQPYQTNGSILDFRFPDGSNTFYGVNEFRTLDLRSLKYKSKNIRDFERDNDGYHFYLWPDQIKTTKPYIFEQDLNGRYQILAENSSDPAIDAEYVYVYFSLPFEQVPDADVYVTGMLADWQFRDQNKMYYNARRSAYELRMYLKQGFYNYHYALLKKDSQNGDPGYFEGNHTETGNEYTVYVYYREPGARYDILIGVKTFNSKDYL